MHMSVPLPSVKILEIQQFSLFFVTEATCYSPSDYVPFGQGYLLCQWTCTTLPDVLCHSKLYAECLLLSSSFILSFPLLFQHSVSLRDCLSCSRVQSLWLPLADVSIATDTIPKYSAFLFRDMGFLYHVEEPSQVLCARLILFCKNSRVLN